MRTIECELTQRASCLRSKLDVINTKYANLPEGSIYLTKSKGKTYYYYRCSAGSRYIKKSEKGLIRLLLQKAYINMLRSAIMRELAAINSYLAAIPPVLAEDTFDLLEEDARQFVSPELESEHQLLLRWVESDAEAMKVNASLTTDYETNKGEHVRSKSEYMLANMLFKNEIPYIYEKPLRLSDGKTVYPDFTILDVRNRRELILEHLGMMDDAEYLDKNLKKLKEYSFSGYHLGDRLLITMESRAQPLNIKAAELMVLRALGLR
ncbi:MAG: hypothetical protein IKI42_05940 [Clostridia bacterium]|nr:hypothetical protein [Clostridia bacterium]